MRTVVVSLSRICGDLFIGLLHVMVSWCIQLCHYEENQRLKPEHWRTRFYGSPVCW